MLSFLVESGVPLGGGTALHRWLRVVCLFFVEGVPIVAFDAQCSPGPANSLYGDIPGAENCDPSRESLCLFAEVSRCLGSTTRSWSVFVLDLTGGVSLDVT